MKEGKKEVKSKEKRKKRNESKQASRRRCGQLDAMFTRLRGSNGTQLVAREPLIGIDDAELESRSFAARIVIDLRRKQITHSILIKLP